MRTLQSTESVERSLSIGFAFCQINITPAMDNVHWVRESFSAFKAKKGQGGSAELINAKQRCVSSPRFFRLQVLLEALWPVVDLFLGRRRGSLWREFPLSVFSDERNRCFQRKVIPSWFYNFNAKWFPVDFTISMQSDSQLILQFQREVSPGQFYNTHFRDQANGSSCPVNFQIKVISVMTVLCDTL